MLIKIILRILIILVVIFVVWFLLTKFKNPRTESINIVSGCVGGGKTSSVICRVRRQLFRNYFLWRARKYKHNHVIFSSFPIGTIKKGKFYNYIKVAGRKFYTYDLTLDYLLLQKRFKQDEVIIICDEFSKVASQFDYNNPNVKYNIDEFSSFIRHIYNNKATAYFIDQCSENIFFQVRRRSSYCYNMISCHKLLLLPIITFTYRKILLSDEVKNTLEVSEATDESELRKFIFFCNPFKYYDTCCYSDRFIAVEREANPVFRPTQKRPDVLKLRTNKPTYYKPLVNDGISEAQFEVMSSKK